MEKLSGFIIKFVSKTSIISEDPGETSNSNLKPSESIELCEKNHEGLIIHCDSSKISESSSESVIKILGHDPGMWPQNIDSETANILVKQGPIQIRNQAFPTNEAGRKFSVTYYDRIFPNNEKANRDWLVYSISKDSVYCFCCKIFEKKANTFITNGYSDWQHLSLKLKAHEKSVAHSQNMKSWITLGTMLKNKTTVDQVQQRILDSEKKHWINVLERVISVIKFLARQCLAFRGSSKTLYEHNNGNFLKAVEMIATFDSVMQEHLRRIISSSTKNDSTRMVHYLGDSIQNEIIDLLGSMIKTHILNKVRESKYYSLILDCTPDVSHTEQITVIIRYVYLSNIKKEISICENFIGFAPITTATGESLLQFVMNLFSELNLNIENLRGQGYDNGSNMRGKHIGLQKRILDINNRAFYVPCSAHSLNLVVNDAADISHETVNFFNIVQEVYVFFSSSVKRWSIICKHLSSLNLKPLSTTRWSSRVDAVKPLRYNMDKILDALEEIFENISSEWDSSTTHKAHSLALNIQNFKFICSTIIWFDILNEINYLSKMMQSPILNIKLCIDLLKKLIKHFEQYRSDESFEKVLEEAGKITNDVNSELDFPPISTVRRRKKTRFFDYEQRDEVISDPKLKFKVEFFNRILDQTLSSLNSRFEELETYNNAFGFLSSNLQILSNKELMKHCTDLQLTLQDDSRGESDIDGLDLYNELNALKLHFSAK